MLVMVAALLVPVLLLIATPLLERLEARMLDVPARRERLRTPLRLEAAPADRAAARHLTPVADPAPTPIVLDAPRPLPRAS
jgi:hypothetical protein